MSANYPWRVDKRMRMSSEGADAPGADFVHDVDARMEELGEMQDGVEGPWQHESKESASLLEENASATLEFERAQEKLTLVQDQLRNKTSHLDRM